MPQPPRARDHGGRLGRQVHGMSRRSGEACGSTESKCDRARASGKRTVSDSPLGRARARGMSEMARAAGLTREALCKALRASAQPRLDTVQRVCTALGVRLVGRLFRCPPPHGRRFLNLVSRKDKGLAPHESQPFDFIGRDGGIRTRLHAQVSCGFATGWPELSHGCRMLRPEGEQTPFAYPTLTVATARDARVPERAERTFCG